MKKQGDVHQEAVKALEEHGHLFQQGCLADIEYHCSNDFFFQSEEYPISIGQEETTIDFIFRSRKMDRLYLVFECKRANPDYVTWLFPMPRSIKNRESRFLLTRQDETLRLQTVEYNLLDTGPKYFATTGLEISERANRRIKRSRADSIWSACEQVLTGVGGLALEQREGMRKARDFHRQYYLPIVITTANLLVTEYRVSEINLKTGNLSDRTKAKTTAADWVVHDFPVRDSLQVTRQEQSSYAAYGPTEEYRRKFKTKSVAIINASSVVRFLHHLKLPEH